MSSIKAIGPRRLFPVMVAAALAGSLLWFPPAVTAAPAAPRGSLGAHGFHYLESLRHEVAVPGKGTLTVWKVSPESLKSRTGMHEVGPPPADMASRTDVISSLDVAWVALAYMKAWEVEKMPRSQEQARKAIATLLALQRPDGTFPAYLSPEIQRTPFSGRAAEDDWMATARATQALGAAFRLGGVGDRSLQRATEKALILVEKRVGAVWAAPDRGTGQHERVDGQNVPAWLPARRSDVAAGLVLGLLDWCESGKVPKARETARHLCEGIVEMQRGTVDVYPWGAFLPRSDPLSLWYGDGCLQASAVARAGTLLARPTWLSAAAREGDGLMPHVLVFYHAIGQFTPRPEMYPLPASAAACMASNGAALFRATGKDRFAVMAGLAASWLEGSNGRPGLLNRTNGRCADYLTPDGPSPSASPASSAAALYALLDVTSTYGRRYLASRSTPYRLEPLVLEAAGGRPVGTPFSVEELRFPVAGIRVARLGHDSALWLRFQVTQAALYRVDMVYLKESDGGTNMSVRLDGDAIIRVVLEGCERGTFLQRQAAVPDGRLEAGLHIVAARGDGLMLSRRSALAGFVVQPVTGWRVWETPTGYVALLLNTSETPQAVDLPPALHLTASSRPHVSGWDGSGASQNLAQKTLPDGSTRLMLPARCYGILEWQKREGHSRREANVDLWNHMTRVIGR